MRVGRGDPRRARAPPSVTAAVRSAALRIGDAATSSSSTGPSGLRWTWTDEDVDRPAGPGWRPGWPVARDVVDRRPDRPQSHRPPGRLGPGARLGSTGAGGAPSQVPRWSSSRSAVARLLAIGMSQKTASRISDRVVVSPGRSSIGSVNATMASISPAAARPAVAAGPIVPDRSGCVARPTCSASRLPMPAGASNRIVASRRRARPPRRRGRHGAGPPPSGPAPAAGMDRGAAGRARRRTSVSVTTPSGRAVRSARRDGPAGRMSTLAASYSFCTPDHPRNRSRRTPGSPTIVTGLLRYDSRSGYGRNWRPPPPRSS